jgi:4-amino-4-deoxy-L-arabinose transferase-like glycosyltransferase
MRWMGQQQGSYGPDGHLYSRKGIGTTLVALPTYWLAVQANRLGNVQAAMLTNGLGTALTGLLIYLLLRRLEYGRGIALAVSLAFGLGTMAWPYARTLFSEPLAGLGLMASFYFLVRYRDQRDRSSILLAGAGLALALLARLNNAIVAPFLGLLLLAYVYRHHGRRWRAYIGPIILFAVPVAAALVVSGWYNWLRFGSPLTTGYLPEERFATPFFEGLYGLTLSPGKGLFWYNPLLFAALAAWPAFFRRHRPEGLLVAAVVLSNLAFYASWFLWWAGHAWGPRFLVTILPFAILPLAAALEAATRRRVIALALGVLAAASVAVQLVGVAVDFNLYLEEVFAELGLYHPATLFDPA